jgi:hypothetical protein
MFETAVIVNDLVPAGRTLTSTGAIFVAAGDTSDPLILPLAAVHLLQLATLTLR